MDIKLPVLNVPFKLHIPTCPVNTAKSGSHTCSWGGNATRKMSKAKISKHPKKKCTHTSSLGKHFLFQQKKKQNPQDKPLRRRTGATALKKR